MPLVTSQASELQQPVGGRASRRLSRWRRVLEQIDSHHAQLQSLDDKELLQRSLDLRRRAILAGKPLTSLLPEAFALVCESASRQLGMPPYRVQQLGAIAMHHGFVAEMQTGEGKTLTATLPVYFSALTGKGVHVATANDYLARRDAQSMGPVYQSLGLTVGHIQSQMPKAARRQAYACDVTYGTAKEFGFDSLRDRSTKRRHWQWHSDWHAYSQSDVERQPERALVQRRASLALIDEADNILIDEAQTPLIISGAGSASDARAVALYQWCAQVAEQFREGTDFEYREAEKRVTLTPDGHERAGSLPKPHALDSVTPTELRTAVERAIKVARDFTRDRHYVVRDGEVVIVDEFTGRLGEGRKWQNGVHQAVEAKEGLEITVATSRDAQITIQEFILLYPRVAGMTGTASTSRRELAKVYGLRVVTIPTNRPCQRAYLADEMFVAEKEKWAAIVNEVRRMQSLGRPVLVGTQSIDKSEHLSSLLTQAGIEHEVLNAKQDAEEARIIAEAGQRGKVTVATNMAGRGTDIRLGEGVVQLGGLYVICTELHGSQRIDRQLAGRCARQGDPGVVRRFLSLEDDVLAAGLGTAKARRIVRRAQRNGPARPRWAKLLRGAQRQVERKRFDARQKLMRYVKHHSDGLRRMGLDPRLDFWFS